MNAASPAPESPALKPPAIVQKQAAPEGRVARWRRCRRELKLSAAGFDLQRILPLAGFLLSAFGAAVVPNATVQAVVPWMVAASVLLIAIYFGHILFFRLQCSLLEFCVIIAALGNLEGLLLTTPGIFSVGRDWVIVLAPLGVAWLFYGAVIGLVQAELCDRRGTFARLFHIAAGWLSTGAPALLALGAILWFGRNEKRVITPNLAVWAIPMLVAGALGIVLRFWIGRAASRAAKEISFQA